MAGFFRIFLSNALYGFCDFAKEVTPSSCAKAVRARDHFYNILPFLLEGRMTSLVCLTAVIWVVTAAAL